MSSVAYRRPGAAFAVLLAAICLAATATGQTLAPEPVDTAGFVGEHADVAVDALGRIHVSYYDASNGDLKWARKDTPSSNWIVDTVDTGGGADVGLHTGIAVDSNNVPHISYYDRTNGNLKYAKGTPAGSWETPMVVDQGGASGGLDVGSFTDIAIDIVNNPWISYYDSDNERLKLAYRSGSSWYLESHPARLATSEATSIVLDHQNSNPIIAHFDANSGALRLALFERDFTSWATEIVTYASSYLQDVAIGLDNGNEPHISYVDVGAGGASLRYAKKDCVGSGCSTYTSPSQPTGVGTWNFEVVDTSIGEFVSIALDGSSRPHVSYEKAGQLRYSWRSASWTTPQVVDAVGFGSGDSSIDIGPDGPHIVYHDSGDLKHAHAAIEVTLGSCSEQDLLSTAADGFFDFSLTNSTGQTWTEFHLRCSSQSASGGPSGATAVFLDASGGDAYVGPGTFSQPSSDRIDVHGLSIPHGGTFDFRVATLKTGGFGGFYIIGDCARSNTPAGTGVVVQPQDETTGTTPVTLTFEDVTTPGETTLVTSDSGPIAPTGFRLCDPPIYFDLSTTAATAPGSTIEVCIDLSGLDCGSEGPTLQHYEDTDADGTPDAWVDVTAGTPGAEICGVVSDLSAFAIFVPRSGTPCVNVRRSLTGEQPNAISVTFGYACDPTAELTAIEFNMGTGHSVGPTSGITCSPSPHSWTGAGTEVARIDFDPPLAPGESHGECIVDDLGAYWDSGQSITVYLSCSSGPTVITAPFDHFFDIVTYKTFRISEAVARCEIPAPAGFAFDEGGDEGWTLEGAYHESGAGPFTSNFSFAWEDAVDSANPIPFDPLDGSVGSIGFTTPGGHGVPSAGNTFWIMRFYSPDLTTLPHWQSAAGYAITVGENMAADQTLYANLFVRVYDVDQDRDRFFYNGTATPLELGMWNDYSFKWSTIETFPTNYVIRNVFVNVWGEMSGTYDGGVYLDDVFVIRGTGVESSPPRATVSVLYPPAPNPFNPRTALRFDLHRGARVDLKIYDVAGRLVRTLISDALRGEGPHVETWDGRDEAGRLTASGVYVARLRAGEFVQTRRMVLLK